MNQNLLDILKQSDRFMDLVPQLLLTPKWLKDYRIDITLDVEKETKVCSIVWSFYDTKTQSINLKESFQLAQLDDLSVSSLKPVYHDYQVLAGEMKKDIDYSWGKDYGVIAEINPELPDFILDKISDDQIDQILQY
jgi:hypothetical protein